MYSLCVRVFVLVCMCVCVSKEAGLTMWSGGLDIPSKNTQTAQHVWDVKEKLRLFGMCVCVCVCVWCVCNIQCICPFVYVHVTRECVHAYL